MSVVTNPKTLVRLWASLNSDFESLLAKFMGGKGWRYIHFAQLCQQARINLILHITQGKGKTKDEHYQRVTDMVLQLAKDLWLRAGQLIVGREKTKTDELMQLKRGLGGFYLLYTLYEKQPIRDRIKICLGLEDLEAMIKFYESIQTLEFQDEVFFMIQYLTYKEAFYYCVYPEDFRFDASTRYFLNSSKNEVVDLTRRMRDGQDILAYSSMHERCEETFQMMGAVKNYVAKDLLKTVQPAMLYSHLTNISAFELLVKALPTEGFRRALRLIDGVVDKPVQTLQTLTATEALDRRMMMETRRRMERARKKAVQALDRDGEHKAARPYVREGGIFGRKKEVDEADDKGKRRERGACNGNLWIYINGHDFDKRMKEPNQGPVPESTMAGDYPPP